MMFLYYFLCVIFKILKVVSKEYHNKGICKVKISDKHP